MNHDVELFHCQKTLGAIWYIGAALMFVVLLGQTLSGDFSDKSKDAWGWFFPSVLPTLLLITGALVSQAFQTGPGPTVKKSFYHLALGLSCFYLVLVLLSVTLANFIHIGYTRLELMSLSNLWLGPVQGLLGMTLGVFFGSRKS